MKPFLHLYFRRLFLFLAVAGSAGAISTQPCLAGGFQFALTGSMTHARSDFTATLLQDGRVLVAGGYVGGSLNSAELYDPVSGTWSDTPLMNVAHSAFTATLLRDGKVLVVAGGSDGGLQTRAAELYDPATDKWTLTGSLHVARCCHTATLLKDGRVLVAGGTAHYGVTKSAELYDPVSGTWTLTGNLVFPTHNWLAKCWSPAALVWEASLWRVPNSAPVPSNKRALTADG